MNWTKSKRVFSVLIFLALFLTTSVSCFSQQSGSPEIVSIYQTFKFIKYNKLPPEIKLIMRRSRCGEIGESPSYSNDYTSNYDNGYSIDLNGDNLPEYIFSCEAPPHGPGIGKVYSQTKGVWSVIADNFPVFMSDNFYSNIEVLSTTSHGYHDILRSDILSTRSVIMRFIWDRYYPLFTPQEVSDKILFELKINEDNAFNFYFGISDNPYHVLYNTFGVKDFNNVSIYALHNTQDAQFVKEIMLSKGLRFLNNFNKGQIIFCLRIEQ